MASLTGGGNAGLPAAPDDVPVQVLDLGPAALENVLVHRRPALSQRSRPSGQLSLDLLHHLGVARPLVGGGGYAADGLNLHSQGASDLHHLPRHLHRDVHHAGSLPDRRRADARYRADRIGHGVGG